MIETTLNQLTQLLVQITFAVVMAIVILRGSGLLFGIHLINQVKEKNQAASWLSFGILVMIGIIVGLFKI